MPQEENLGPPSPEAQKDSAPPNLSIPKIRTFKTDAEIFIKEGKLSTLDMAAKTYASQKSFRERLPRINFKIYIYILGGAIMLAGAGYFGYRMYLGNIPQKSQDLKKPEPHRAFLQVENETDLLFPKGNGGALISSIKISLSQQHRFGTINHLRIKPEGGDPYIDSKEFMGLMGWNPPPALFANLEPAFNLLLIYRGSPSAADRPGNMPVFVFLARNFPASFAALLEWETGGNWQGNTLWQDFRQFIDLQGVDPALIYRKTFEDDLVKNNDARVFRAPDGATLLEYAFFNKKYILISPSRDALELVLGRFLAIPPS